MVGLEGWPAEKGGLLRGVVCLEGWSTLRDGLLRGVVPLEGWSTFLTTVSFTVYLERT